MNIEELKALDILVESAIKISIDLDVLRLSEFPSAVWKLRCHEGGTTKVFTLTADQKSLIKRRITEDLEEDLDAIEKEMAKLMIKRLIRKKHD